jgi:hypothetical protein
LLRRYGATEATRRNGRAEDPGLLKEKKLRADRFQQPVKSVAVWMSFVATDVAIYEATDKPLDCDAVRLAYGPEGTDAYSLASPGVGRPYANFRRCACKRCGER